MLTATISHISHKPNARKTRQTPSCAMPKIMNIARVNMTMTPPEARPHLAVPKRSTTCHVHVSTAARPTIITDYIRNTKTAPVLAKR